MASVQFAPDSFHTRSSTSPFGFGFGLSNSNSTWPSGHTQPSAFHQLASSVTSQPPLRTQKRRLEDDEGGTSDAMDKSWPSDRPIRGQPKKARVGPPAGQPQKSGPNTAIAKTGEDDVDIGLLLASIPSQSLLPLLNAMLSANPALKSTILPLIPRPTIEAAIQALALSAKKLSNAYPYSNTPSFSTPPATPPTFGSGFGAARTSMFGGAVGFGYAAPPQQSMFSSNVAPMRDDYISSRLQPHITEFVAACMSYLPYFSWIISNQTTSQDQPASSHASTIQRLGQENNKFHPHETFMLLSAITSHFFSQPPLAQTCLSPALMPRMMDEWNGWVNRIDQVANHTGMFGRDQASQWMAGLDAFAARSGTEGQGMRRIRDKFVSKVGWLVGRSSSSGDMEEEL